MAASAEQAGDDSGAVVAVVAEAPETNPKTVAVPAFPATIAGSPWAAESGFLHTMEPAAAAAALQEADTSSD